MTDAANPARARAFIEPFARTCWEAEANHICFRCASAALAAAVRAKGEADATLSEQWSMGEMIVRQLRAHAADVPEVPSWPPGIVEVSLDAERGEATLIVRMHKKRGTAEGTP